MEQTQISNEEKALNAEIKRIKYVNERKEMLTAEYLAATKAWEEKKANYIARLDSMEKSIKSGEQYIKFVQSKLSTE